MCLQTLKELNLGAFIRVEESVIDMAVTLLEKGLAHPQKAHSAGVSMNGA